MLINNVNAQNPELVVQTGHSLYVNSIAFSPDGRLLASGSADNTIKLWDAASGQELKTLLGSSGRVNSIAFSPDGRTLASGAGDSLIRVWDVEKGVELRRLKGHTADVNAVSFSPNGKVLASGSHDQTVRIWDVQSGEELSVLTGHACDVSSVAFKPGGRILASGSRDNAIGSSKGTIKLWDVGSGKEIRTLNHDWLDVYSLTFSPDGDMLATGDEEGEINLWEVDTGKKIRSLILQRHSIVSALAFSPNGRTLASGDWNDTARLWNIESGAQLQTLIGHSSSIDSLAFSPDGRILATGSADFTIKLWDLSTNKEVRAILPHTASVNAIALSPDGKEIASAVSSSGFFHNNQVAFTVNGKEVVSGGGADVVKVWNIERSEILSLTHSVDEDEGFHKIRLWDVERRKVIRVFEEDPRLTFECFALSPDGRSLASGSSQDSAIKSRATEEYLKNGSVNWKSGFQPTVKLWDLATGKVTHTFARFVDDAHTLAFSPDGSTLAVGSYNTIQIWNARTGEEIQTLNGHCGLTLSMTFNHDGKTLIASCYDNIVEIWDVRSGKQLRTLHGHTDLVQSAGLSPDGRVLATGSRDKTIKLWNLESGTEVRTFSGHTDKVFSVAFMPNGILASGSEDRTIKLWDIARGKELVSLFVIDDNDWAVVDSEGRFDASERAQKLMHFVVDLEPIDLTQLKERYYEPDLLAKVTGFNKEPLRDVSRFENPKLGPDVSCHLLDEGVGSLAVTLVNRGGGIGRVQVFVNGKEYLADARDEELKANANTRRVILNIDLSKATNAFAAKDNDVRVVAWNVENYISSQPSELVWTAGGSADRAPPEVYAIIGGISSYSGSQLKLNFAAKDAVDIAHAIELGAKRLFGADKVHLTLLSTSNDSRSIAPTKDNFAKAFSDARKAKPTDILIVYLAGHGVTLQRGSDTYCYLTEEARTTDTAVISDSGVRKRETITSEELVEWIKQIPANKQVIVLDTCAAGAAQAQLGLMAKREVSGDAFRAIARARDRTGSYILMGSAADAASYEASQYGQGLLTYALLKGMKGPALSNDEFIDVAKLFHYAGEEVEGLAKNTGGIQKPIIFAPRDDSFDVGQLKNEDKQKIALTTPKPIILRPRFLDARADDDTLDLMKSLRALLRNESFVIGRGASEVGLVFVDDDDFPGGIRPTGKYFVRGRTVTVSLHLRRDGVEILSTQVTGIKDNIAGTVLEAIKAAISKP